MNKKPAERVISAFSPKDITEEVARAEAIKRVSGVCNVTAAQVRNWLKPKDLRGGTGGLIPQKYHLRILKAANEKGYKLDPLDLLNI
jgi:hypothetical protein